jgi:hypothetical protein
MELFLQSHAVVAVSSMRSSIKAPSEREKSDARIGSSEHEVARLKVIAALEMFPVVILFSILMFS